MAESDLDPTTDEGFTPLPPHQEAEVSALLAGLRDPAVTMPEQVAARLDAAIATELADRASVSAPQTQQPEQSSASGLPGNAQQSDAGDPPSDTSWVAGGTSAPSSGTQAESTRRSTRFPGSKALFATAVSIAALALLIGRPWVHDTGTVVAGGPTRTASDAAGQQRGGATLATPRETMVQVSRHSYQRSSLARDAAAFLAGQGSGAQVRASAAPKQWQAVTVCVDQTLSVLGAAVSSKVDLGWLDGKPSAIVVISDSTSKDPATQVRVLQVVNGRCTIAARTSLAH